MRRGRRHANRWLSSPENWIDTRRGSTNKDRSFHAVVAVCWRLAVGGSRLHRVERRDHGLRRTPPRAHAATPTTARRSPPGPRRSQLPAARRALHADADHERHGLPDARAGRTARDHGKEDDGPHRIGYLRRGGEGRRSCLSRTTNDKCNEGWYELVSGGFVCGEVRDARHEPSAAQDRAARAVHGSAASVPVRATTSRTARRSIAPCRRAKERLEVRAVARRAARSRSARRRARTRASTTALTASVDRRASLGVLVRRRSRRTRARRGTCATGTAASRKSRSTISKEDGGPISAAW